MKHVQVIGQAGNGVYDIFCVDDQVFDLIFPTGTDIAFAEDLKRHPQVKRIVAGLEDAWKNRIPKRLVRGIHGTLFYEFEHKRQHYPTLRDEEAINPDGSVLRARWPPHRATDRESTEYEEGRTHFANVDFEVFSRTPLDRLVAALGRKVSVLYNGAWKPGYAAMLEWGTGWNWPADRRIRRFVQAIEALPRRERRVWDAATARRFDIGIEAGYSPHMFQLHLKPSTVEAVARVKGEIVVSVYAPVGVNPHRSTQPTGSSPVSRRRRAPR